MVSSKWSRKTSKRTQTGPSKTCQVFLDRFRCKKGQIGYVPGNYLQERLGRNSSLAHRYCEVGLNQLITESTTRVPTSENRALIKKISDLKKRIQRWSLDGDSSLSESELKPRLAPPQRTGKSLIRELGWFQLYFLKRQLFIKFSQKSSRCTEIIFSSISFAS